MCEGHIFFPLVVFYYFSDPPQSLSLSLQRPPLNKGKGTRRRGRANDKHPIHTHTPLPPSPTQIPLFWITAISSRVLARHGKPPSPTRRTRTLKERERQHACCTFRDYQGDGSSRSRALEDTNFLSFLVLPPAFVTCARSLSFILSLPRSRNQQHGRYGRMCCSKGKGNSS